MKEKGRQQTNRGNSGPIEKYNYRDKFNSVEI